VAAQLAAGARVPTVETMLTDRANLMLDLWDDQLATADEVLAWAESELVAAPDAAAVPAWLLDLLRDGPARFADASHSWRRNVDFKVRFAMHATRVDREDRASVERFARWVARAALGGDLESPEVMLGHEVDHYLDDHRDVEVAVQCIRDGLPSLMPTCQATLAAILGRAAGDRR
jgi:hypothetical protein